MNHSEISHDPQASADLEPPLEALGDPLVRRKRDGQAAAINSLLQAQLTHYIDLLQGISDLAEEIEGLMYRTTLLARRARFTPPRNLPPDRPASRADASDLPGESYTESKLKPADPLREAM